VKERHSDFRLICATNRDLQKEISGGRFRNDLFFRINAFPIVLPPLRECPEDIVDLAHFLLATVRPGNWRLTPEVSALLTQYSWPGNARELKSVLERAVAFAHDKVLALEHFPGLPSLEDDLRLVTPKAGSLNLAEMERALVQAALEGHPGDMVSAAVALGISRATLYRRVREFGLRT